MVNFHAKDINTVLCNRKNQGDEHETRLTNNLDTLKGWLASLISDESSPVGWLKGKTYKRRT